MLSKLRTVALTGALMTAAIPAFTSSADAAWWGRGGWGHGWGWGGVGIGLAAGALVGAALTSPYYGGYSGYGYPAYGYGYGYGYPSYSYGYDYPSEDYSSYGYAPAYYGGYGNASPYYGGYSNGGYYGRRFYAYGGPIHRHHLVHRRVHYAH